MTNSLKKLISILSASAIAFSIAPVALAEDLEVAADATVVFSEDFEAFAAGNLVDLSGSTLNETYADRGITFSCGGRANSSSEVGIKVSSSDTNHLEFWSTKYNDTGGRQPQMNVSTITSDLFANDMMISVDAYFKRAGNLITITDSANQSMSYTATESDLNKWITVLFVVTDDASYTIATDRESGETLSFAAGTTLLSDLAILTIAKNNNTSSQYVDNLVVSDGVYELPDDVVLGAAMDSLVITEGQFGMTTEGSGDDKVFVIEKNIALPSQPDGVTLEWVVEQSADGNEWTETSYASVSGNTLVIAPTEDSANYLVRATANVTCGELSDSVSFMFKVVATDPNAPVVYYNEDFSGFADGTVANMSQEYSNNTSYEITKGMTFTSSYRADGAHDTVRLLVNSGKYLEFSVTQNLNDSRKPKIDLSRTASIEFAKKLFINVDIQVPSTANSVVFIDSNNNELALTAPSDDYVTQWLNYTVLSTGSNAVVLIKDADGNVISYQKSNVALSNVKQITMNLVNVSGMYIDNLYIADENYEISDEDILNASLLNINLDGTQANLTSVGDAFDAKGDFILPESPEGSSVTWAVEEKTLDSSEWTESDFISVSGTNATVNPTNEIDNYDVRLVATVTCGEVTDTKTFTINLPNPLDEIAGVIASGYEVVESADYTDATNTTKLTYDLGGEETLKFDLVLPSKVSGYRNSTIAWSSSDEALVSIDGSTATIMTDDLEEHDVTLTAVVTYKKGNITYSSEPQSFDIKVGYTEADIEDTETYYKGKYKVRFDAAYADNFEDIPEETTSDIDLPTEGKFGSKISWSSSAPSVISNSGDVSRAASDKDVTLTASLISGAGSAEKSFVVTVPKKKSSGGGGGGGGGSTSSTGTISTPGNSGTIATNTPPSAVDTTTGEEKVSQLQEEAAKANDLFDDIGSAAWAREAINGLAAAGIVNGKTDTSFAPNDTVTRAEFAKMLMGVFGLGSGAYTTSSFGDVSTSAWYFNSVETAYNLGIINGVGEGKFAPNALITRQDMAVMVVRAANVCGVSVPEVEAAIAFADEASISAYAKAAVAALQKADVINGVSDTAFAPLDNATRAQAAQILYNTLKIAG